MAGKHPTFLSHGFIPAYIHSRGRLLRANLLQPLKDMDTINARLDCLVSIFHIIFFISYIVPDLLLHLLYFQCMYITEPYLSLL